MVDMLFKVLHCVLGFNADPESSLLHGSANKIHSEYANQCHLVLIHLQKRPPEYVIIEM